MTGTTIESTRRAFVTALPAAMGAGYETRPAQHEMAAAVATAFDAGRVAVVEAETGLGKGLAYLVPLIEYCKRNDVRAVVSTYTRNLQRQLFDHDVPLASRVVGREMSTGLLMGRTNYACKRAIQRVLEKGGAPPGSRRVLNELLEDDGGGDLDAMRVEPRTRALVPCPSKEVICSGCGLRDECHLFRARRKALASQLVLVNHALLFANVSASGALLGEFDVLVVDEAHRLPEVATDFLSLNFTPTTIRGGYDSVYSPEYEEVIAYARARVAESDLDAAGAMDALWSEFITAVADAHDRSLAFFAALDANVRRSGGSSAGRGDNHVVYKQGAPFMYGLDEPAGEVEAAMGRMSEAAAEIEDIVAGCEALSDTGVAGTIRSMHAVSAESLNEFRFLLGASDDEHVFYAGRNGSDEIDGLYAVPVDVGPSVGALIEDIAPASVLTSATLAVGDDFSHALDRLGLAGSRRVDAVRYGTPFDLDRQRLVLVAAGMPDPGAPGFTGAAADAVAMLHRELRRRMLVLCTSRLQLDAIAGALGDAGEHVYAQQTGASRADLLARYREDPHGILLGLASFWEGIDLPGDLVELLVIVKLPFMVPTDPVVRARMERLSERGENAFEALFIPDVVLRLRQGMGRLIRTGSDYGAVILLDRRVVRSAYGGTIMTAVSPNHTLCDDTASLIARAGAFLDATGRDTPGAGGEST